MFILVNNNSVAVSSARKLVQHLELPHFELGTIFEDIKKQPINSAICGLYGTDFPLWKLGELLDETWVGEDVLNGLAELLYLSCRVVYSTSSNLSPCIFFVLETRKVWQRNHMTPGGGEPIKLSDASPARFFHYTGFLYKLMPETRVSTGKGGF